MQWLYLAMKVIMKENLNDQIVKIGYTLVQISVNNAFIRLEKIKELCA